MNKKKIIATASAIALAAMLAFGGTLAYYEDQADSPVENTFVDQGNSVSISESDVDSDGSTQSNTYSIIPGTTDTKDPVVTAEFTLDSYVYVKADDTTEGWIEWAIANGWTSLGDGYDGIYYMLLKTVQYDSETWTDYSYTDSETNLTYSYNSDSEEYTVANNGGTTLYTYTVEESGATDVYTAKIPVILNDTVTYSSNITNSTFTGYGTTVSLDFTAYIIQASLSDGTDGDDDYGEKEYANPTLAYYYADQDGYYESAVADGNVAAINEKLYSTVDSAVSAAADGETVTLLKDVTLDSAVTISKNITFDLAGSTLTNASSNVVKVNGDVTLTDSSDASSGSISGGNSSGVVSVAANASLTMESGTITGENSTASTVYGVNLSGSAAFTMNGGTIEDCKSYGVYVNSSSSNGGSTFIMNGGIISGNKGGVYVKGQSNSVQSTFTMNDGTISGNTVGSSASSTGGGVTVHNATFTMNGGTITGNTHTGAQGGGVYINANGTFTMNGGTISNNSAGTYGGGVCLGTATSAFTMTGGSIINNTATRDGGGVYFNNAGADFNVSGSPVINSNTVSSSANNIYLLKNAKITLTGELSSGADIGVTVPSTSTFPVQITAAESETSYYTSAADYIKSDSDSYTVQSNSTDGYLELVTNTNN